jgi:hypothetical protein
MFRGFTERSQKLEELKMLKKATILALSIGLAAPAYANDQLARAAGVDHDMYTLAELVKIMSYSGRQRDAQIELIHRQRAAFDARVRDAVANGPSVAVGTRSTGN